MKTLLARSVILIYVLFCCIGAASNSVYAEDTIVTIGTGGVTGVFYQAGGAISRIVNQKRQEYGIRCTVESTEGSVYNVNAVVAGELDFALVQSDRQFQAVNGEAEWKTIGPRESLRSIFSLYTEPVTLCAAVDSNIETIVDLAGKRVNLGNIGSGHRQNSIDALIAAGINYEKDLKAFDAIASEAPKMLLNNEIDAFFYTVGHPTGAIIEATSGKRTVKLISLPVVANKLVKKYPYYVKANIPIKYYPNAHNDTDIETFGVKATFVTSKDAANATVYAITKEIFENFEFFSTMHEAFLHLDKKEMLKNLAAPLHPGALRYYKEAGLQ